MQGFDFPGGDASLLDALDVIAWIADPATLRFSYVNQAGTQRLGFPREQWLREQPFWPVLLHAADREAIVELCAAVAKDGEERTQIHRVADSTGTVRWFRTRVCRLSAPPRLFGEMVEVTELVREREAARQDKVWLDLMLAQVPAIIWTVDRELRFTAGAGAATRIIGVSPEQIIGVSLEEFLRMGDSMEPDLTAHRRALEGEASRYRGHFGAFTYDSYVEPLRAGDRIVGVIGIAFDVTEQARAEQQKRLAEQRYQQIVEISEEGIWTVDAEGVTTFVNPKMASLFGHTASELIGRSAFDLVPPSSRAELKERLGQRSRGVRERYEMPILRGDGSELWVELSASPIFDERSRYIGSLGLASDISARREAETERERVLRESNARRELLEVILQHAPMGILVLRGSHMRVEVANPAARALAPGKQPIGRRWYEEVNPELAALRPALEDVLRTGQTSHLVDEPIRLKTKEGEPLERRWISSTRVRIQLPDGTPGILLLITDTTASVLARQEIDRLAAVNYARAAQLRAVLENMDDSVTVYDQNGIVTFANRSSFDLFGLSPAELLHRPFVSLAPLLDPRDFEGKPLEPGAAVPMRALAGNSLAMQVSLAQVSTGRRVLVRMSGGPLRDPQGHITGAVLITRDITATVEFERLKDQFIEVAAHELKSPVAIMKTNAQLLLETGTAFSDMQLRMARAIDRGANRIDKIIQNLLDISQLQLNTLVLQSQAVDLDALIRRVVRRTTQTAPGHPIRLKDSQPGQVWGDPHRLEWIIAHIIDNAVQHSPEGGGIDVEVVPELDAVTVTVRDQGAGIPPDRQSRIFERFYRAHTGTPTDVGGLGVSLHIAREILRRLGGEIWFRSEPGQGTTFGIRIPAKATT